MINPEKTADDEALKDNRGSPKDKSVHEERHENKREERIRLALIGIAALLSWLGVWRFFLPFDFIAITATLLGGVPVYKETFLALSHRRVNMEVSMAIAIFASLAAEQFTVSVVITFFVLLSEYIETYAVDKGRETIVLLEKSIPKNALIRKGDGTEAEVDVKSLQPRDIVIVREGERIPVDGTILAGSAFVNQSAITGESARVEKDPGDKVYAGSINESGVVEIRTEKVGNETLFGKIIRLVDEAENRKAPIQKISDRLATWLIEFAIGFSLLTFILTRNLTSSISVIVVAGACGVAAGTPLAIVATIGKAAKEGAIVKGGIHIEEINRIDTVVIDKTGTLTFGEPVVTDVVTLNGYEQRQVLQYAAIAERYSNHPLAHAIIEKASESGIKFPPIHSHVSSNYIAGKGVVCEHNGEQIVVGNNLLMAERNIQLPKEVVDASSSIKRSEGKTAVLVAHGRCVCGIIAFSDRIRGESRKAIADLKQMGINAIMLTGDNKEAARAVSKEVGIDEVYTELLPEEKVSIIERLVAQGKKVAMVGDGVNDAPALARANVGIGMGAGTDVAIEEADIVLMTNDLKKISDIVRLSKKAHKTIMQNFFGTVSVDGFGVALAFLGFLSPLLAAIIHVCSEFIFILNSAKLITR